MVRALWNGAVIAESDDTVMVDGNHYFPADAVDRTVLVASDTTTVCPWKGRAGYYSIVVDGKVNRDAAWYYPAPSTAASAIEGRIAFWHGVKISDDRRSRHVFDRFRRARPETAPEPELAAAVENPVVDLDDESFVTSIDGQPTIVDFWASWCGPCKSFHPDFERAASQHAHDGLRFARVSVDAARRVATTFEIISIPTIIVFDRSGHEIDRQVGVPGRRRLEQMIRHAGAGAATAGDRGLA